MSHLFVFQGEGDLRRDELVNVPNVAVNQPERKDGDAEVIQDDRKEGELPSACDAVKMVVDNFKTSGRYKKVYGRFHQFMTEQNKVFFFFFFFF